MLALETTTMKHAPKHMWPSPGRWSAHPGSSWRAPATALASLAAALGAAPTEARVTRIVIDSTTAVTGQALPYQTLRGRAFGELDPNDPHNAVVTDIQLAKD